MNSQNEDPIVAEIRTVRQELSEQFGNDIEALCDFLAEKESEHSERLVNLPPKAPQFAAAVGGRRT
jgi:hypothetical protein